MGGGLGWSSEELLHLYKAYIATSADPINSIEQTSALFLETMLENISALDPPDANQQTYRSRSSKYFKSKMNALAADVQNFLSAWRLFKSRKPTDVK